MGTFAETAIIDYHLLFADQGKPISVFHFRLQQTNGSLLLHISVCSKQVKIAFFVSFIFRIYFYICCRFKRKTEAQAIFLYPFTVCSSGKQKFVVCPIVDEETKESYLFGNGVNGLAHLWSLP